MVNISQYSGNLFLFQSDPTAYNSWEDVVSFTNKNPMLFSQQMTLGRECLKQKTTTNYQVSDIRDCADDLSNRRLTLAGWSPTVLTPEILKTFNFSTCYMDNLTQTTNSGNLSLFQGELVAYNSENGVVTRRQINKQVEKYVKKNFGLYFKFLRHTNLTDNSWYLRSRLYEDQNQLMSREFHHFGKRQTQGMEMILYSVTSAAGHIASAAGYYYLYHILSDARMSVKSLFSQTTGISHFISQNLGEIVTALALFTAWYQGHISDKWALLGLGGLFVYNTNLRSLMINAITQLMPAQSTQRHTQGNGNVTTFAQNVIGILTAVVLGTGCTHFDFNHLLTSVKSLGSSLNFAKTCESVLISIIQFLPDIFRYFLSNQYPALGMYVAVASDETFKKFISETVTSRSLDEITLFYNSHNLAVFFKNYNYLKNEFIIEKNVVNGNIDLLQDIIQWYDEKHEKAGALGLLPTKRKMPFVIWISGAPGIGKSTMVREVAKSILIKMFGEETVEKHFDKLMYTFNTNLKYMDGYNNQPIFVLNDYLQYVNENEEQWLIRFADTNDCPLEVSSVDNIDSGIKGEVRFTSRIIIVTSNMTYLNSSVNVANVEAFNRRRDMLIDMTFKQGSQVNFENFDYSWARIRQLPSVHSLQQRFSVFDYENKEQLFNTIGRNLDLFNLRGACLNEIGWSHTLKYRAEILQEISETQETLLKKAWNKVTKILNIKVLGVKLSVILPLLLVGSSGYLMYKACIPMLVEKVSQSASGDVTTKKLKKNMVPINRITLGSYSQNLQERAMTISKNMVKVTAIIHVPGKEGAANIGIRQQMWGWSPGGSLIITPKHLWRRGKDSILDGDTIIIERGGIEHKLTFKDENLTMSPDRDIACYNVMGDMLPFKNQENLVLADNIYVNTAGEPCCIVTPQKDTKLVSLIENEAYITDAPYVDPWGAHYAGDQLWQYNQKFNLGDCGSVMLLTKPNLGGVVAGMHVAGDSFSGNSEVITQSLIKAFQNWYVKDTKQTQGFCTNAEYDDDEYFDAESELEGNFYFLGSSKNAPFQQTRTDIVKSPLFEVLQPHQTEPAVLSPSDVRLEEVCSPMLQSVAKYGVQVKPFSPKLMDQAFNIVQEMYNPIKQYDLKALSFEDAINATKTPYLEKVDLKTSAGYPWAQKGKKKTDLISKNEEGFMKILPELQNVLNTCENLLNKKTMFPYTLTTTLKDERVSLQKVKIGKTRTFMNFPVEYTLLMRRYFDDFIDKETKHAMQIGTTVGVNIYSSQWDKLYNELIKYTYSLDGDFKAFDGTIRPEFFRYYTKLVNSFYRDEFKNHRSMLVSGCCFAPIFVLNKVYVKQQGNPSGSRITTSFNSFVNRMYVVMSILKNVPEYMGTSDFILDNVKIYAHGDDHLIGFNQAIRDHWDGLKLRDFMLSHGIDYTSSVKDSPLVPTRRLHECFYLKSHFVWNAETRRWQAGLSKDVIQEMVSWQRDSDISSTTMIVNTALRYAYFWGRDYFALIRDHLDQALRKKHIVMKLVDYNSLETEYNYSDQLVFDYV